jgi:hypothetical protein
MSQLTFAFMTAPGPLERQGVLLARSIRAFAGELAQTPLITAVPNTARPLTPETSEAFIDLDVRQKPFAIDDDVRTFPFAAKVSAAAAAESVAETAVLAWLDTDSLFINPPTGLLPPGKQLGYRPVDHLLIGSRWDQPPSPFWRQIYADCDVDAADLWPMTTSVDEVTIRPYFNAGMLVVRPERRLLQTWRDDFARLYRRPVYDRFYQKDRRYTIFMHQAVLAGTLLRELSREAMVKLPHQVNYPLHMHTIYPQERRAQRINDLISCRYDTLADDPAWHRRFPIEDPLRSWLEAESGA